MEGLRKTVKNAVGIADFWTKIWTQDFLTKSILGNFKEVMTFMDLLFLDN